MSKSFRVVDVRPGANAEAKVQAASPEEAARLTLGMGLVRGGNRLTILVAKVYSSSTPEGPISMVRLYARKGDSGHAD